jgi:hypothetical protein
MPREFRDLAHLGPLGFHIEGGLGPRAENLPRASRDVNPALNRANQEQSCEKNATLRPWQKSNLWPCDSGAALQYPSTSMKMPTKFLYSYSNYSTVNQTQQSYIVFLIATNQCSILILMKKNYCSKIPSSLYLQYI